MWFAQAALIISVSDGPASKRQPHRGSKAKIRPHYKRLAMGGLHSVLLLMVIHFVAIPKCQALHPEIHGLVILRFRSVQLSGLHFVEKQ